MQGGSRRSTSREWQRRAYRWRMARACGEPFVRQRALPLFVAERTRFALRFTCEYCTYFRAEDERCTHGYPNAEHKSAHYEQSPDDLLFCKDFELL